MAGRIGSCSIVVWAIQDTRIGCPTAFSPACLAAKPVESSRSGAVRLLKCVRFPGHHPRRTRFPPHSVLLCTEQEAATHVLHTVLLNVPHCPAATATQYESAADLLPSATAMLETAERRRRQRSHPDPRLILTRSARLPYHYAHRQVIPACRPLACTSATDRIGSWSTVALI